MDQAHHQLAGTPTPWLLDLTRYDRSPDLRPAEAGAIAAIMQRQGVRTGGWPSGARAALARLMAPLDDVLAYVAAPRTTRAAVIRRLLQVMAARQASYWAWTEADWLEVLDPSGPDGRAQPVGANDYRQYLLAVAYLLCGWTELPALVRVFAAVPFATKIFGAAAVEQAVQRVREQLVRCGYIATGAPRDFPQILCLALLVNRSPHLEDLTLAVLERLRQGRLSPRRVERLLPLSRALVLLGIVPRPLPRTPRPSHPAGAPASLADVPAPWAAWCQRWLATTTLAPKTRKHAYYHLLKAGRWLAATYPDVTGPEQWTRELAAAYVAAVDRLTIGEWTHAPATARQTARLGQPLAPRSKAQHLWAVRIFLQDAQEWGWIPRRFDPVRALATPRAILALIAPAPRVIADDIWAKLLWAGLNLSASDLPAHALRGESWYPLAMVRAVALTWLFAGLRADELRRLRVGCIRWQRPVGDPDTVAEPPARGVCLLDVPTHKTGTAYTKPVDRVVGEAIAAWEDLRPEQAPLPDAKTGDLVHFLFAYRGEAMSRGYLNRSLIPLLCRKAGVPTCDARGPITSHRARSTIASQLYNAREPLSLFELQAWLGHQSLGATQHYARVTPTALARAYADAEYFRRNLRMVEVLIDQEAIRSGAATAGAPWRFYDLGHGYCTYAFFDQCPHRLVCAKCAFYVPKGSSRAQLLEGQSNLLRLRQEIPLTDDEMAAVEDGLVAYERLLAQLADVPTPAGPTPRELGGSALIPADAVRRQPPHEAPPHL